MTLEWIPTTKRQYFERAVASLQDPESSITIEDLFELLGVCPAGFVDEFTAAVVALESDASTYHVMPHGGGILDESGRLINAFREVRRARDDFYTEEQRRRAAKKR